MEQKDEKRRKIDAVELESLVEQGDNDRLKSIIENSNDASTQNELLHMAVKHNKLEFLKYLLTLDFDVNARDSFGSTPLLLAASMNNFEAVQSLLHTDADVCVSDMTTRSTFEILSDSGVASADLIRKCLEKFSVSNVDPRSKARILMTTNCSLRQIVLTLKDAAVTRAVLNSTTDLDSDESVDVMQEAMKLLDVENVRALLHHGPNTDERRRSFLLFLVGASRGRSPKLRLFETFIRALVDLDVLDHNNVDELRLLPISGREEALGMTLQIDLDVYLRKTFGFHLVAYIFTNPHVDSIEMLRRRHFDVNARSGFGTALHWALADNSAEKIQFLLNVGADPNIESEDGCTPVIDTQAWRKDWLGQLLLQHGADVQAVSRDELTVFSVASYKPILGCVLPQLAIVEAQATPILQRIRDEIFRKKLFKNAYAGCCKELEALKKHELSKSLVTLFAVLTEKTEVLAGLLHDEDKISVVDTKKMQPYFRATLELKLKRALNVHHAKCNVARLVSKYSGQAVAPDHLVVEKIFSLLRYYDMASLASVQL